MSMSELKTNPDASEMADIRTPSVLYVMHTIKAIQKRMKDPDLVNAEYIRVYDTLGREFQTFADSYTAIFTKVIRGESLSTIASALYYKNQVALGLITEAELSEMLAAKYLPAHLKQESDQKIKEMRESGQI